jgi:hypothetical protein
MRRLSGFRLVVLRKWSALPTRPPQRMMALVAGAKVDQGKMNLCPSISP